MKKNRLIIFILTLILFIPSIVFAKTCEYKKKIGYIKNNYTLSYGTSNAEFSCDFPKCKNSFTAFKLKPENWKDMKDKDGKSNGCYSYLVLERKPKAKTINPTDSVGSAVDIVLNNKSYNYYINVYDSGSEAAERTAKLSQKDDAYLITSENYDFSEDNKKEIEDTIKSMTNIIFKKSQYFKYCKNGTQISCNTDNAFISGLTGGYIESGKKGIQIDALSLATIRMFAVVKNYSDYVDMAVEKGALQEDSTTVTAFRNAVEDLKNTTNKEQLTVFMNKSGFLIKASDLQNVEVDTSVLTCDDVVTLYGSNFGSFLKMILSFIRYAVPIVILAMSIKDYIVAITAQDASSIKKATTLLIKRLIIGVIIFVLPTLLDLVLKLAGVECGIGGIGY